MIVLLGGAVCRPRVKYYLPTETRFMQLLKHELHTKKRMCGANIESVLDS